MKRSAQAAATPNPTQTTGIENPSISVQDGQFASAQRSGSNWVYWSGIALGLLVISAIGVIAFHNRLFDRHAVAAPAVVAPARTSLLRTQRLTADTLVVPNEVIWSFSIHTQEASAATRPRFLPPLTGCLAADSNRLAHVSPIFAGEVVFLGTVAGGETDRLADESATRPLQVGDRVKAGQLLAVVWSKDLGEKKSELVDALSRLKVDQETFERLEKAGEGVAQRQVREANVSSRPMRSLLPVPKRLCVPGALRRRKSARQPQGRAFCSPGARRERAADRNWHALKFTPNTRRHTGRTSTSATSWTRPRSCSRWPI